MGASDSRGAPAGGHRSPVETDGSILVPTRLYDAYILDLDGTLYLGDELLPGARRMIDVLRARGKVVRFVSNNPTKDLAMYAEKLARLGLLVSDEEIVTTIVTMTRWLRANHPNAVVFPIGEAPLIRALTNAGEATALIGPALAIRFPRSRSPDRAATSTAASVSPRRSAIPRSS